MLSENTYGTAEHSDRLSSTTFANGQTVSYAYDEDDNITAVSYNGTVRYSYTYDEEGVLQSMTDNASGIKTVYTETGTQLRRVSDNSLLFSVSSDENGNEVRNIAGDSITYVYDSNYNSVTGVYTDTISFETANELTENETVSNYSTGVTATTNTDWFGRVISKSVETDNEKNNESYSIDSSFVYNYADTDTTATTKVESISLNITNETNTVSRQEHYEYDAVGNITGIYRMEENEKVYYNKYYYDEANQLIREDNRLGEFTSTYTYDVGGNIVSRIRYPYTEGELTELTATETHTYSYTNAQWGDVLTSYNGQAVTYDAMGNITSLNGDSYTWTAGRQLSRVTKGDDGTYTDYFYDDNGQIAEFRMYSSDGTLNSKYEYFWEDTQLYGTRVLDYTTDENNTITENEVAKTRVIYDVDGEALGFVINDAVSYLYMKNILGDVTGIINAETSEILFEYAYDAYGNYELKMPNGTPGQMIGALIFHSYNPVSYRGYVFTPAAGVCHYLGSRFYVPMLCRFMNADIYADTAQGVIGTNMFAYCNNNPVMFTDTKGTLPSVASFIKIVKRLLTKIVTVINFLNREKSFQDFIYDTNSIIIKKSKMTETKAYDVSILISPSKLKNTTKTEKEFYEAIYENYKIDKVDTINQMVDVTTEKFYQITQREILFSDDCLYEEIEEHLKAFWWAIGITNTPNTIALLYAAKESKQQVAIACASIDIKETDPIYEKETAGIKPQSTLFNYYNGIRDEYSATIYDPYYDKKHGRDYFTVEWRMP